MTGAVDSAKALEALKRMTEETDDGAIAPGCEACGLCPGATPIPLRELTDEALTAFLECNGWDVRRAAYEVLLHKARADNLTLGSGLVLPDTSEHWLRLAQLYRPNRTGNAQRGDEAGGDSI